MQVDAKGFILSSASPRGSRMFIGIRAAELKALERSPNPSLRKLAQRVRDGIANGEARWQESLARGRVLEAEAKTRAAAIAADPVKRAEREKLQQEIAELRSRGQLP